MKGQSAIDLLMLILLLSTAILALSAFATPNFEVLSIRANALKDKRALLSLLQHRVELNNSNGTTLMRGRIVDLITFQACNGCPPGEFDYCSPLAKKVNSTLFLFNSGQKHYLLTTASAGGMNLTAFDKSSNVCLEKLPLARFSFNTTCGDVFTIVYASWFPWQQVGAC